MFSFTLDWFLLVCIDTTSRLGTIPTMINYDYDYSPFYDYDQYDYIYDYDYGYPKTKRRVDDLEYRRWNRFGVSENYNHGVTRRFVKGNLKKLFTNHVCSIMKVIFYWLKVMVFLNPLS